jgi:hypothetical protein
MTSSQAVRAFSRSSFCRGRCVVLKTDGPSVDRVFGTRISPVSCGRVSMAEVRSRCLGEQKPQIDLPDATFTWLE